MKKLTLIILAFISFECYSQEDPYIWEDGYYHYYVRLIIEDIPASDFDKADFINHLTTYSNPSSTDIEFLNNSIIEVSLSFPSSQWESSLKVVTVISDYNSMHTFLISYSESVDLVEIIGQGQLNIDSIDFKKSIIIYPLPVSDQSYIHLDLNVSFKILKIYDVTGKELNFKDIENLQIIKLNKYEFDRGIYFFKFISDERTLTKKIIFN